MGKSRVGLLILGPAAAAVVAALLLARSPSSPEPAPRPPRNDQAAPPPTEKVVTPPAGADPVPAPASPYDPRTSFPAAASGEGPKAVAERLVTGFCAAVMQPNPAQIIQLQTEIGLLGPEIVAPLAERARRDPQGRVRSFCVRALGQRRDPALFDLFRESIEDESPFVRFNAAWALGELGDPKALPALEAMAARESDVAAKEEAARAVERLR